LRQKIFDAGMSGLLLLWTGNTESLRWISSGYQRLLLMFCWG
jgi:hypothetical protein